MRMRSKIALEEISVTVVEIFAIVATETLYLVADAASMLVGQVVLCSAKGFSNLYIRVLSLGLFISLV